MAGRGKFEEEAMRNGKKLTDLYVNAALTSWGLRHAQQFWFIYCMIFSQICFEIKEKKKSFRHIGSRKYVGGGERRRIRSNSQNK